MLSGESAMGVYPEEAVAMLARIAAFTEAHRRPAQSKNLKATSGRQQPATVAEAIASVVEHAMETVPCAGVSVPTRTGTTARMISRCKPRAWIIALSHDSAICQGLAFSFGVQPVLLSDDLESWCDFARQWFRENHISCGNAMLVAGPSTRDPGANHRIEFMREGEP